MVSDSVEAQKALKQIQSNEINGLLPRKAYLVQYIPSELEIYTAITYNSKYLGPSLTVSLAGGMDIEDVGDDKKLTVPVDIFRGLDAYQASQILSNLNCPKKLVSVFSRCLVDLWDMFISTGMRMCEVNPWRVTPNGKPYICDFKAIFDEVNFKFKNLGFELPEYPVNHTAFEEEMDRWNASSYQGQAHVCQVGDKGILPILFGGGASTIITETLIRNDAEPIFLSDFGGNPPYERMLGTAKICFEHHLANATLLLILGGKANNTLIDVTFKAIADALRNHADAHGTPNIPVIIGRGGQKLVQGMLYMKDTLDMLSMPYVMFGPDTPVTMVAEYAAKLSRHWNANGNGETK